MNKDKNNGLKYCDAEDKLFGVAGMLLGLMVIDCEGLILEVDIDREDADTIVFSPEFDFVGASVVRPSVAWNHLIKRMHITTSMLISNVMCRSYVHRLKGLTHEQFEGIKQLVASEGHEACQLERDETDNIFYKDFEVLDRAFRTRQVHSAAQAITKVLSQKRHISLADLLDIVGSEI